MTDEVTLASTASVVRVVSHSSQAIACTPS